MEYTTTVQVVTAGPPAAPVPGVRVGLFDRDRFSGDDELGSAVTDANGEAVFRYDYRQFGDVDESLGPSLPDLYAVVYNSRGEEILSTRHTIVPNRPRKRMTVPVARELLEKHGLIPA